MEKTRIGFSNSFYKQLIIVFCKTLFSVLIHRETIAESNQSHHSGHAIKTKSVVYMHSVVLLQLVNTGNTLFRGDIS